MKRLLHMIALILLLALALAVLRLSRALPADTQPLLEKKYSAWSGVLRGWVCSRWQCSGSFITWLNTCSAGFEKDHPGVYLEFTSVSEQAMQEACDGSMRPPELLFFSPDFLKTACLMENTDPHPNPAFQYGQALPVCMGAYVKVVNNSMAGDDSSPLLHLPDDPGRCFSRAAEGLRSTGHVIEAPSPGIDLGLPVSSEAITTSLSAFTDGQLPSLVISQLELARLQRLRDAGQGPDWSCEASGTYMYADQLLLGGITAQHDPEACERSALASEFLQFLLTDACQQQLSSIGASPAIDLSVYPPGSVYAEMEGLLRSLPLVPAALS